LVSTGEHCAWKLCSVLCMQAMLSVEKRGKCSCVSRKNDFSNRKMLSEELHHIRALSFQVCQAAEPCCPVVRTIDHHPKRYGETLGQELIAVCGGVAQLANTLASGCWFLPTETLPMLGIEVSHNLVEARVMLLPEDHIRAVSHFMRC